MFSMTFFFLFFCFKSFYTNWLTFFLIFFFAYVLNSIILTSSFRQKIIFFYIFLCLVSLWGFTYHLESFVFLLLLGELLIILIFSLIFLTLQFLTLKKTYKLLYFILVISCIFTVNSYWSANLYFIDIFNFQNIFISDDFFLFFFFFFFEYLPLIFLFGLILSFFSIFFIFFYSSFKFIDYKKILIKKNKYLLRKQNLQHQINYKNTYFTFQR